MEVSDTHVIDALVPVNVGDFRLRRFLPIEIDSFVDFAFDAKMRGRWALGLGPQGEDLPRDAVRQLRERFRERVLPNWPLANHAAIVGLRPDTLVGYVTAHSGSSLPRINAGRVDPYCTTVAMYLRPEYQGQRIGSQLASALIPAVQAASTAPICAETFSNDERAVKFIDGIGFRQYYVSNPDRIYWEYGTD